MRKRLRKKMHKGEFKEMGFYVQFRLADTLNEEELDAFLDQFFKEVIEANDLGYGGGGNYEWLGLVGLSGRGSATDEHRAQVDRWLHEHPQVIEHDVSGLIDAWYDTSDWPGTPQAQQGSDQ